MTRVFTDWKSLNDKLFNPAVSNNWIHNSSVLFETDWNAVLFLTTQRDGDASKKLKLIYCSIPVASNDQEEEEWILDDSTEYVQ